MPRPLIRHTRPIAVPPMAGQAVAPAHRRQLTPPIPTPPDGPTLPSLKTSVEITYTWNQLDLGDYSQNSSTPILLGYMADKWLDATRARVTARGGDLSEVDITTTPGSVQFTGEAVFDFLACGFDVVSLGHSAPKEHIAVIRAKADKDIEVIHQLMNFDSINQNTPWNQVEDENRAYLRQFAVVSDATSGDDSDGLNRYGCRSIDKFELVGISDEEPWTWDAGTVTCAPNSAPNFTKHTWDINVATAGAADGWCDKMLDLGSQDSWVNFFLSGSTWLTEGFVIDNILDSQFKGGATNDYPADFDTTAEYHGAAVAQPGLGGTGMKGMLARMEYLASLDPSGNFKVWGNAPDAVTSYPASLLQHRFVEHWFRVYDGGWRRRTLAELSASIDLMAAEGIRINVGGLTDGNGPIEPWFTGTGPGGLDGTWAELSAKVDDADAGDLFIAQACRATSNGHLFWQPEFAVPA